MYIYMYMYMYMYIYVYVYVYVYVYIYIYSNLQVQDFEPLFTISKSVRLCRPHLGVQKVQIHVIHISSCQRQWPP